MLEHDEQPDAAPAAIADVAQDARPRGPARAVGLGRHGRRRRGSPRRSCARLQLGRRGAERGAHDASRRRRRARRTRPPARPLVHHQDAVRRGPSTSSISEEISSTPCPPRRGRAGSRRSPAWRRRRRRASARRRSAPPAGRTATSRARTFCWLPPDRLRAAARRRRRPDRRSASTSSSTRRRSASRADEPQPPPARARCGEADVLARSTASRISPWSLRDSGSIAMPAAIASRGERTPRRPAVHADRRRRLPRSAPKIRRAQLACGRCRRGRRARRSRPRAHLEADVADGAGARGRPVAPSSTTGASRATGRRRAGNETSTAPTIAVDQRLRASRPRVRRGAHDGAVAQDRDDVRDGAASPPGSARRRRRSRPRSRSPRDRRRTSVGRLDAAERGGRLVHDDHAARRGPARAGSRPSAGRPTPSRPTGGARRQRERACSHELRVAGRAAGAAR